MDHTMDPVLITRSPLDQSKQSSRPALVVDIAVKARHILVTGGSSDLGAQVIAALASRPSTGPRDDTPRLVSLDLSEPATEQRVPGVVYVSAAMRNPALVDVMREYGIDTVVHLAAVVTPHRMSGRGVEYHVDLEGTRSVLEACVAAAVSHLIVASTGAAYGCHPDNPPWLHEDAPLRGNEGCAYAGRQRLLEGLLAEHRLRSPQLNQTVFRIGTILGTAVNSRITALFETPRPLAIMGKGSPFVFIWDQDVVNVLLHAIQTGRTGIYNVAGDGALTIHEIARRMGKRCRVVPAWVLQSALWAGRALRVTSYGPEHVRFLRYRPVLHNRRLKEDFGYVPRKSSREVFDFWWKSHNLDRTKTSA